MEQRLEFKSRRIEDLFKEEEVWEASYELQRRTRGITYMDLMNNILDSKKNTVEWCMENGLISGFGQRCSVCNYRMTLKRDCGSHPSSDFLIWSCRRQVNNQRHNSSSSIRNGSWFSKSKLTMAEILQLTYGFCHGWTEVQLMHETGISDRTAVDWYSFCREVTTEMVLNRSEKLGGPGKVVEIDESKFGKRKYHRGHHVEGQWVFCGLERESGKIFMVPVESRGIDVLLPIIKDYILPGTTIISDYWRAYDCLDNEGYQHLKVNHSINFKDPETGAHTNGIEGSWLHAKKGLPKYGCKKTMIAGYLAAHLWRRRVRHLQLDPFTAFINDIVKVYNPNDWNVPHSG